MSAGSAAVSRGIFVSFEGSEGCGKSTQVTRLAQALEAAGHRPLVTREPGGTSIGEAIRHLLQFDAAGHTMAPETELLLFAASRAQIVREVIRPALAAGQTVIADRFSDSTTVYQGVARGLDPEAVRAINGFAVGDLRPDVTFLLHLDGPTARRRLLRRPRPAAGRRDRMESQPAAFYDRVRAGYLELARREPDRFVVIDAGGSVPAVAAAIRDHLAARYHGLFAHGGL